MDLNIGQVVHGRRTINDVAFAKLAEVARNISSVGHIYDLDYMIIRDNRFSDEVWPSVLHKELLNLYSWMIKRILYNQKTTKLEVYGHAICFQPYYGITLHYLRRAIPFVLLGIELKVVFADHIHKTAEGIINVIHDWLGIAAPPVLTKTIFTDQYCEENSLFIVTGKESTFEYLKREYKPAFCIGATGSGALLIIEYDRKHHEHVPITEIRPSCTNVCNTIYLSGGGLIDSKGVELPDDYIKSINPTVIYTSVDLADVLCAENYKCILLNEKNQASGVGLCADPIHGYPGDYLY